jgi:Flp pilus assembly protein TadD
MAGLRHAAGVANSTAGRQQAAIAHYRAAHELEPTSAQFALYLGVALAHNDQWDDAQALLAQAMQLAPNSPDPHAALADLALRRGDTQGARAHIAKARSLAPDSLPLRLADARIRRIDKHPEESVDMLMALDPPVLCEPGVAEELALAHTSLGDFQAAAHALQASASAKPTDWRRAVRCADAWQRAGDPVKAQLWVQHALSSGAPVSEFQPPEPRP